VRLIPMRVKGIPMVVGLARYGVAVAKCPRLAFPARIWMVIGDAFEDDRECNDRLSSEGMGVHIGLVNDCIISDV
jgi:hypothetical protein